MIFNLYGKSDAAYCSITLKYVNTSGTEISATTVKYVPIGNSYTVVAAPTLSGYSFKEQSHATGTKLTINSNIVITYKYLTYYTVTYKYINTSGSSIKTNTTASVLEGNTHTIGTAPTISNYNYKSCSHTIGGTITVKSNVTVTYTYEQAIMYLYNEGDVTANTGGWKASVGTKYGSASDKGTYLSMDAGGGYGNTGLVTKSPINFSNFTTLHVHFKKIQWAASKAGSVSQSSGDHVIWGISSSSSLGGGVKSTEKIQSFTNIDWTNLSMSNVEGTYNISNINASGYLNFYVIGHLNGGWEQAELQISKIWLE